MPDAPRPGPNDPENAEADGRLTASQASPPPDSQKQFAVSARRRRRRDNDAGRDPGGANPWVRRGLVFGLAAAAAAIAGLVLAGMQEGGIYAKPVDELIANQTRFAGRPVRAEGNLVHGTLVKRDQPCEYRFTIAKKGVELPVRYAQCVVPDTFRDVAGMDVGVTVEGELKADNTFEATSVLAKCPSKYEMKELKEQGKQMPHGATASESLAP